MVLLSAIFLKFVRVMYLLDMQGTACFNLKLFGFRPTYICELVIYLIASAEFSGRSEMHL